MIPKIIHQTNKTKELSAELQKWYEQVSVLHPSWKFHFWTDEDNRNLVRSYFPKMLEIYDALPYNIMRVDVVRYMYMSVYGGVYLDLDYELLKPLDNIISETELLLPLSREQLGKKHYKYGVVIGNSIFASAPGHIFWEDVLKEFYENPPVKPFSDKSKIVHLTGPDFITNVYFKNPGKYGALLPARDFFHPDLEFALKNYKKLMSQNECFGIHHCKGSWLREENSLPNQMARLRGWFRRRINNLHFKYFPN